MITKYTFTAVACLTMISCNAPKQTQTNITTSSSQLKPLSVERWATAERPRIVYYPAQSGQAKLQGDVVLSFEVDSNGKVDNIKKISGAGPLAFYATAFAKGLQFKPEPSDFPGPWSFSITMRFDLKGFIGVAPTGSDIVLQSVIMP